MRKPALVRAIFAELRSSLGPEVSAGDALRLAHVILRAYLEEANSIPDFGRPGESRAFCTLPVDVAMSDGGWRVLDFEISRRATVDELDIGGLRRLRPFIEKYLGETWQHQNSPPAQL